MQIGARAHVFRRVEGAAAPAPMGAGRVIHPCIVQLDAATAASMRKLPHRSEELTVGAADDDRSYPVARIRPGLVGHAEAAAILAEELPEVSLLPVDGDLVFLETSGRLVAERCCCEDDPWWCRIVCRPSCTNC